MSEKDEFIHYFREIQPKFSRLYTGILSQAQLTLPQYALLNLLVGRGEIPMTEASGKLQITKPAVTNLVDRLEKNRFLKRIPHSKDRRIYLLQIQPKGERVVREAQGRVLRLLLKTLNEFSGKERKTISRFYGALSRNLEGILKH